MIGCKILYVSDIITLYVLAFHMNIHISQPHTSSTVKAISCTTNQHPSFSNLIFCNYFIHLITSLTI